MLQRPKFRLPVIVNSPGTADFRSRSEIPWLYRLPWIALDLKHLVYKRLVYDNASIVSQAPYHESSSSWAHSSVLSMANTSRSGNSADIRWLASSKSPLRVPCKRSSHPCFQEAFRRVLDPLFVLMLDYIVRISGEKVFFFDIQSSEHIAYSYTNHEYQSEHENLWATVSWSVELHTAVLNPFVNILIGEILQRVCLTFFEADASKRYSRILESIASNGHQFDIGILSPQRYISLYHYRLPAHRTSFMQPQKVHRYKHQPELSWLPYASCLGISLKIYLIL